MTPIPRTVSALQVPSGSGEPPRGYQVRLLPNGGTEIVPPWPWTNWLGVAGAAAGSLLWAYVTISWLLCDLGRPAFGTCISYGWPFDLAMLLIGLGFAYLVLHETLLRHSWVAGPGWIARRTYEPWGRFWDRVYSDLAGFEIHHGIWDTRRGTTDTLCMLISGGSRKIVVEEVGRHQIVVREPRRRRELHELTVDPDVAALGHFLANKTGTPLSEVTEEIPAPRVDMGGDGK